MCNRNVVTNNRKGFQFRERSKNLNKSIRHLKRRSISLQYLELGIPSLHIFAYAHASHENNPDQSSQLCVNVTLCDALEDAFDYVYMLKNDKQNIFEKVIPFQTFADSKSLFDVIIHASTTKERRLMIDIAATRQAYSRHEIAGIRVASGCFGGSNMNLTVVCIEL